MQTGELSCLGPSKAPFLGCLWALFGLQRPSCNGHQLPLSASASQDPQPEEHAEAPRPGTRLIKCSSPGGKTSFLTNSRWRAHAVGSSLMAIGQNVIPNAFQRHPEAWWECRCTHRACPQAVPMPLQHRRCGGLGPGLGSVPTTRSGKWRLCPVTGRGPPWPGAAVRTRAGACMRGPRLEPQAHHP